MINMKIKILCKESQSWWHAPVGTGPQEAEAGWSLLAHEFEISLTNIARPHSKTNNNKNNQEGSFHFIYNVFTKSEMTEIEVVG
jgi:hypothetical protein